MLRCKRLLIKYYLPFGKPFLRMINYDPWTFDIRVQRSRAPAVARCRHRPVYRREQVCAYDFSTDVCVPTTRASLRARVWPGKKLFRLLALCGDEGFARCLESETAGVSIAPGIEPHE